MFGRVELGKPWWFWFKTDRSTHVLKVIKDGSGILWTEVAGHGVKIDTLLETHTCLGPISEDIGDVP
jgi:hypothetical protein